MEGVRRVGNDRPLRYRGASLIRNRNPLGPYSRTIGGGAVSYERGTPVGMIRSEHPAAEKAHRVSMRGDSSCTKTIKSRNSCTKGQLKLWYGEPSFTQPELDSRHLSAWQNWFIDSGLVGSTDYTGGTSLGGVPREQNMLKGHLPSHISPSILVYEDKTATPPSRTSRGRETLLLLRYFSQS